MTLFWLHLMSIYYLLHPINAMHRLEGFLKGEATNKKNIKTMLIAMNKTAKERPLIPPHDITRVIASYGALPNGFVKCDDDSLRDIKAAGGSPWDCYYLYLMFEDVFLRNRYVQVDSDDDDDDDDGDDDDDSEPFNWDISAPNEKGFRIARNIAKWNGIELKKSGMFIFMFDICWEGFIRFEYIPSCAEYVLFDYSSLRGNLEFKGVTSGSNHVQNANLKKLILTNGPVADGQVDWKTLHSIYPKLECIRLYQNFHATVEFDEIIKFAVTNEKHSIEVELSDQFPLFNFVGNNETMGMVKQLIQISPNQKVVISVKSWLDDSDWMDNRELREAIINRLSRVFGSVGFSRNIESMYGREGLILKRDNFTIE